MLQEFISSCELVRKVELFESLITQFLRRQQEILVRLIEAKSHQNFEFDLQYLQDLIKSEESTQLFQKKKQYIGKVNVFLLNRLKLNIQDKIKK